MFSPHVRFAMERMLDVLVSMDPRFTLKDLESAVQRDTFVSKFEQFATVGNPRSVFLLVADTLVSNNPNSSGDAPSAPSSRANVLDINLLETIMFTTRVTSLVGIRHVIYAQRLGPEPVDSFGTRALSVPQPVAHSAFDAEGDAAAPFAPSRPSRQAASPIPGRGGASTAVGSTGADATKGIAAELRTLQSELVVGVVDNRPAEFFAELAKDVLMPLAALRHAASVASSKKVSQSRHASSSDSRRGSSSTAMAPASHPVAAIAPQHQCNNFTPPEGYCTNLSELESLFARFTEAVESRVAALDELGRQADGGCVLDLAEAQRLMQGITCSPSGYTKAAQDATIAASVRQCFEAWCAAIEASKSKDLCGGYVVAATGGANRQGGRAAQLSVTGDAARMSAAQLSVGSKVPRQPGVTGGGSKSGATPGGGFSDPSASAAAAGASASGTGAAASPTVASETIIDVQLIGDNYGPLAEIAAWRSFITKSRSTLEQADGHEVQSLLRVLELIDGPLAVRWASLKDDLKAAAEQAVQVHKYLTSIEHVFAPLYTSDPVKAGASVVDLIEAIKLLRSVVPYYNDDDHATLLFVACSNQIVACCREAIRQPGRVWEQADSIPLLRRMLAHFDATIATTKAYRHEFLLQGFGELPELPIFGKLELFCTRLRKMADLFGTVLTFHVLSEYSLEGIEGLLLQFFANFDDLRRKSGDPLDYTKPSFDRDYFEFRKKIVETDCSLQVYVNSQFESVPNTLAALEMLRKFSILMQRESIRADLQAKYLMLFQRYGTDVEAVQRLYEHEKQNPPLSRNSPPVAGKVLWARQLLQRIVAPMRAFQESKALVTHQRETSKIVRLYNRVALALTEFEAHWVNAWRESVHVVIENGLAATLLVADPDTGELIVNFDQNVAELLREAKWLARIGVELPDEAASLAKYRSLHAHVNQLAYALHWYQRAVDRIPAVLRPAMKHHVDATRQKIQPGLESVTWTSLTVPSFLQSVTRSVNELDLLVERIVSIIDNRIHVHIRDIARAQLVIGEEDLAASGPLTPEAMWDLQQAISKRAGERLAIVNDTLREGVEDLCRLLDAGWGPAEADTEAGQLYQHYNRQMFKAVLASVNVAMATLRQHVGSEISAGFIETRLPFLRVTVDLSPPHILVTPSLEDLQDVINRTITSILSCSQYIGNWPYVRAAYSSSGASGSFFEEISRNKEVVKNILLLTGAVFGLRKLLDDFLLSFTRFNFLWNRDAKVAVKAFAAKKRPLEEFEEELVGCRGITDELDLMQDTCIVGCLAVDCQPVKVAINRVVLQWKALYGKALGAAVEERLTFLYDKVETLLKQALNPTSDDFTVIKDQLDTLQQAHHWEYVSETEMLPLEDICAVMEHHGVQQPAEYVDRIYELRAKWKRLRIVAGEKREQVTKIQHCYKQDLLISVQKFGVEVQCFYNDYCLNGPSVAGITPLEAIERLKRFQRILGDKLRHLDVHMGAEEVFGYEQHRYPELAFIAKEVASLDKLYTLFLHVTSRMETFLGTLWRDLDIRACLEEVTRMQDLVKRLPGTVKHWPAYATLKKTVDDFLELQPVIEQLVHPSIRERHWREVMRICGKTWSLDRDTMLLRHLVEAELLPFRDEIIDLAMASEKEGEIENKIANVAREWKERELSFAEFKHRGFITLKGDDTATLKEQLEDTLVTLGSVIASRYVAPFRAEAHTWSVKITTIAETLALWVEVQALWMYLEAVFAGGDIMKQLPQEAKRFAMIDKQWVKIFFKATEVCNVVDFCFGNELLKSLPYLKDQLECCQRALASYLEQKRNAFARFFFVSDTVLLEVLSQGSDPHAMQPHLSAIFDGIHQVAFEATAGNKKQLSIKSISSFEGETVPLVEPVRCEGNIEEWLQRLCDEMQRSVRMSMREAVAELMAIRSSTPLLQKYLFAHPAQNVLTALQINFTTDVTAALNGKQTDRKEVSRNLTVMKELLADQVRMDISHRHQTHIETLTTMAVHNQEVWEQSVKRLAKDALSFEWQKQLRFSWTERDRCMLRIADSDIEYCNEYLGVKERLVITPLTDRCYITLSQALAMYMGGAPAGPAGTGKTETVKDLGRAAGKYVVVFNCSDQWDFRSLGKIFKGLAQSGAWGCFDEFNRITLPVLSVVAQQIHTVFLALKQHRHEFIFTDASHCRLQSGVGIFVTMNPGYAGRQELPENLKALFRGVSMMVPDRQAIMKVKLASAGYKLDALLARKFNMLYQMCEQQLSAQRHYDFGLRNILSVLRTAGDVLRRMGSKDEEAVFMRCVRDMNLSKLVFADVPVFLSLLEDMFPGKRPDNARYEKLEAALRRKALETNTTATESWVAKCVQIYETKLVRHGIMVVGPAGSGKTVCLSHLLHALHVTERKHKEVRMNPKAITAQQMFGRMDVATGDWFDGVFSFLWRRYNRERSVSIWLVCDGPVDTLWVESLNTVLDDNKLLTLANGDRVLMSPTLKMCFEVDNLRNASPATVSRAGIIFISLEDVGWQAVYCSAIANEVANKAWSAPVGKTFERLGLEHFERLYKIARVECKATLDLSPQQLSSSLIVIAKPLCEELCRLPAAQQQQQQAPPAVVAEMIFWYALAWSIGGSLDSSDRFMLLEKFRSLVPKLPADVNIYESFVSVPTATWCGWQERVPSWSVTFDHNLPSVNIANIFIPTIESTVLHSMLHTHAQQGRPALLVGIAGSAKTIAMQRFLADTQTDASVWSKLNISRATTPHMAQSALEELCEKRMGATYGPKRNKVLAMFVDDLHMADTNEWGDQVVCELLRQIIEFNGLYSLDKIGEWKHFIDIKFLGAMSISTTSANSNVIPGRLLRHYTVYNLPFPTNTALETIYGGILRSRFGTVPQLASVLDGIVQATLELWRKAQVKLLPTPTRFHYSFNLRDLSRIVQGMLIAPVASVQDPRSLLELWTHECHRALGDKLNFDTDVQWFQTTLREISLNCFGMDAPRGDTSQTYFCNFTRDPVVDEFGEEVEAPKIYEKAAFDVVHAKLTYLLAKHNDTKKSGVKLDLVLFRVAVEHVLRIARVLATPRGSVLVVGVGGSGKQSLTRLAAFSQGYHLFQPTVTAAYNLTNWFDDLRAQYVAAAASPVAFLVTDADLKDEGYLEYINASLAGGEVPGLFNADEKDQARTGIRQIAKSIAKRDFEDSEEWLWAFFLERVRTNLHYVICFSPQGDKFRNRVRRFPGIVAACTISYFFPWPEEALLEVAAKTIATMQIKNTSKVVGELPHLAAAIHTKMRDLCEDYFVRYRQSVHATPKVFLTFLQQFAAVYTSKSAELSQQIESLNLGLRKLREAGDDVAAMRVELSKKEEALAVAKIEADALLREITETTKKAEEQRRDIAKVAHELGQEAATIAAAREEAEADLVAAQPAVEAAKRALEAITSNDIKTLKAMQRPPEMVRRIFDGVCILLHEHVDEPRAEAGKGGKWVLGDSWVSSGRQVCSRSDLLENLYAFNSVKKDQVNDETCELLLPYIEQEDFTFERARTASGNIAGLCTWVRAMVTYREISKFVAPKIEKLTVAEGKLRRANRRLSDKRAELEIAELELQRCQDRLDEANARREQLEDDARRTFKRVTYATELIAALEDERQRWRAQQGQSAETMERLVGNALCAAGFITYGCPLNTDFRQLLLHDYLLAQCASRKVPHSADLQFTRFMVSDEQVTSWQIEGLPMDQHSIENAIFVVHGLKVPLLVDPQEQGLQWIMQRHGAPRTLKSVVLGQKGMMATIEQQLAQGEPLVITETTFGREPVLDGLLERRILRSGRQQVISILGDVYDYHDAFQLFLATKASTIAFDPEVYAKVAVIDFSVTLVGLGQQLLAKVIASEKNELEEQMNQLVVNINRDEQMLRQLEEELLAKLSAAEGSLVDDESLILTLTNSKNSARDVKQKLVEASETRRKIKVARDEYSPVAQRGAVLYFVAVEMASINSAYKMSLVQFNRLYDQGLRESATSSNTGVRIRNIIELVTHLFFVFVGRGLFENHKLLFSLLIACKVQVLSGQVSAAQFRAFLKGGNALEYEEVIRQRPKAFAWLNPAQWKNIVNLINEVPKLKSLIETIAHNEGDWMAFVNHAAPETLPIPGVTDLTSFEKMLIVRSVREDRTLAAAAFFIRDVLGEKFIDVPQYDLEDVVAEVTGRMPILFLLSPGSDPTGILELHAKRRHKVLSHVSLGQGQEGAAMALLDHAQNSGDWVVFQNCHLGIPFLEYLQQWSAAAAKDNPDFRVFLTSEPTPEFPVSLLQRCLKLTNEPPQGMHAAIKKAATWMSQDAFEMFRRPEWKPMMFALCFYHASLLERRKYGSQGWTVAYQFSEGDFHASLQFLQNYVGSIGDHSSKKGGAIAWEGVRFMIGDIQYGGRVTNSHDRVTLQAVTERIFSPRLVERGALLCPELGKFAVPDAADIAQFRALAPPMFSMHEPPQVVGLHGNAELTHRAQQSELVLTTILNVQPRQSAANPSETRESVVLGIIDSLFARLPKPFTPRYLAEAAQRLNPVRPLTIFFGLEAERLSALINMLLTTLNDLKLALSGTIALTPQLTAISDALFVSLVPAAFVPMSWLNKSFTVWFASLQRRHDLIKGHLKDGALPVYQLSCFYNPRGFLNSVRQEVCRRHAGDGWVLDRVETKFTVTKLGVDDVPALPDEGVLISGLYLDGASWDVAKTKLKQAAPKELFAPLPLVAVSAQQTSLRTAAVGAAADETTSGGGGAAAGGSGAAATSGTGGAGTLTSAGAGAGGPAPPPLPSHGFFQRSKAAKTDDGVRKLVKIPCYVTPQRGDTNFICDVDLFHDEPDPLTWTLRGVALLTNTE